MVKARPVLRDAAEADIPEICEIYADEVLNGVSSWEEQPPSVDELSSRFNAIIEAGFPYRVVEIEATIAGYSYASAYRPRSAYRYTVENTIYVHKDYRGLGLGRLLLEDLLLACETLGFRQMVAVIGDSNNHISIDFHKHMGFEQVGIINSIGFKFGRWMDSVIMQKSLGAGGSGLPE